MSNKSNVESLIRTAKKPRRFIPKRWPDIGNDLGLHCDDGSEFHSAAMIFGLLNEFQISAAVIPRFTSDGEQI